MIPRGEGITAASGYELAEAIRTEYQQYEVRHAAAVVALGATMKVEADNGPETIREVVPENNPYSLRADELYVEERSDWQERARCRQADPEAFFPEQGGSTRAAKAVCLACVVRTECLEYALSHDERFGVWGGMSERERRRLNKPSV